METESEREYAKGLHAFHSSFYRSQNTIPKQIDN